MCYLWRRFVFPVRYDMTSVKQTQSLECEAQDQHYICLWGKVYLRKLYERTSKHKLTTTYKYFVSHEHSFTTTDIVCLLISFISLLSHNPQVSVFLFTIFRSTSEHQPSKSAHFLTNHVSKLKILWGMWLYAKPSRKSFLSNFIFGFQNRDIPNCFLIRFLFTLITSIRLWRRYINITITILDIIHRPVFYLKLNSAL
jgi:hypothetical protein